LIAAGGIGDARGFVAALAMGAVGIYMGTAFMATEEFNVPDKLKDKIVGQDILDAEFRRKIYQMDHGGQHSLAAGVVTSVKPVKQYIDEMVQEASEIMSEFMQWGMLEDLTAS